jgi:hypothetical protein
LIDGRRRRRLGSTTSEVSSFTVQWEPVSRLSPGEAMAMAMALAAQQWRRRGGERGNHGSGRVVVMGIEEGGRSALRR